MMKQQLPTLRSDKAAEAFVATADLTQHDLSGMRTVRFEVLPKDTPADMSQTGAE